MIESGKRLWRAWRGFNGEWKQCYGQQVEEITESEKKAMESMAEDLTESEKKLWTAGRGDNRY